MGKKRFLAHKVESVKGKGVWMDLTDSRAGNPFPHENLEASIDKNNHIIKNVCVFGSRKSKNGYTYEDKAIGTLESLTSGAKFFINHPSATEIEERDGVRDIRHWAGVFFNPRKEGDKVYADLKVREAYWSLVQDVATMQPAGVGNSINSRVKMFTHMDGTESVVDMDILKSIDLVSDAATTSSLFESVRDSKEEMKTDFDKFVEEGLLVDKMIQKRQERAINDLTWEANDIIGDVLRDDDMDMESKRAQVNAIMQDLHDQINNITSVMGGDEGSHEYESAKEETENDKTKNLEEEDMNFNELTIEKLATEAPHIIQAIKDSLEDKNERDELATENDSLKNEKADLEQKLTDATEAIEEMKTKLEELEAKNSEMVTKLDEYTTKEKSEAKRALIDTKIKEAKLHDDAVSDVFISDLMLKEEDAIEAAIEDRKELWSKGSGEVKNVGESNKQPDVKIEEKEDEVDLKAIAKDFLAKIK